MILSKCIQSPCPSPIQSYPRTFKIIAKGHQRKRPAWCPFFVCDGFASGTLGLKACDRTMRRGQLEPGSIYIYIIIYMDRIRDSKSSLWCRMSDGPGWPCRASIDSFNLRMSLWKTSLAANLLMICCLNLTETWGACWRTSKSTLQTAVKHRFVSVSCWHSEGNTRTSLNFNNPAFWNHASYDCTCKIGHVKNLTILNSINLSKKSFVMGWLAQYSPIVANVLSISQHVHTSPCHVASFWVQAGRCSGKRAEPAIWIA